MHYRPIRALFIPLFIFIACSSQETINRHRFNVVTEDDIPAAVTSGEPRYQDELCVYRISPAVRGLKYP